MPGTSIPNNTFTAENWLTRHHKATRVLANRHNSHTPPDDNAGKGKALA